DWMIDNYRDNVDIFPSGELSYYDFVLDTAVMVGAIPSRFGEYKGLETYFQMARGRYALEMTKYFNTNYHYLVPELEGPNFKLLKNYPLEDYLYFESRGVETLPRLISPFTFLKLSKVLRRVDAPHIPIYELSRIECQEDMEKYMDALLEVYEEIIKQLQQVEVKGIMVEDPALCYELKEWEWDVVGKVYKSLGKLTDIYLITYYDSVSDYRRFVELPVKALGFDLLSNEENIKNLLSLGFPEGKTLIAGIVNGRQVWKANIKQKVKLIEDLLKISDSLIVSNSCPLFHLPLTVEPEENLAEGLKERLSFAKEKLFELKLIKEVVDGRSEALKRAEELQKLLSAPFGIKQEVRERLGGLSEKDFMRDVPYAERIKVQQEVLRLPLFPTTTIGSFPQTEEVRKARA
ncbi:MAG: 5-methyltetrahydropteroyltriglutamate--homocysteine S-methyltransferase, partial [Aquificaceae bacterium]